MATPASGAHGSTGRCGSSATPVGARRGPHRLSWHRQLCLGPPQPCVQALTDSCTSARPRNPSMPQACANSSPRASTGLSESPVVRGQRRSHFSVRVAARLEGTRSDSLFWAPCRYAEVGIDQPSAHQVPGAAAAIAGLEALWEPWSERSLPRGGLGSCRPASRRGHASMRYRTRSEDWSTGRVHHRGRRDAVDRHPHRT